MRSFAFASGCAERLGFVAYDRFELRILGDGYELWDTAGTPTLIDSVTTTTAGRRNIGIRAGLDAGVWVDGTRILGGPTTNLPRPQARFGTHKLDGSESDPGLILLDKLCYLRSWLRPAGPLQDSSSPRM